MASEQKARPSLRPRARTGLGPVHLTVRRNTYPEDQIRKMRVAAEALTNYKGHGFDEHYEAAEWSLVRAGHFLLEQLVAGPGKLPPPLDSEERERRKVDHSFFTKIPPWLVSAPGEEGQLLRKGLLSGATIIFFTPGYEGKRFIYEHAKELNVATVIVDHPGSWAEKLVEEKVIKKFIPVNMEQDSEEVFKDALEAIQALDDDAIVGRPAGICTFCELSVPMVARLAEALGLPGPSPQAIDTARNKYKTRACMQAAGLDTPANYLITVDEDLDAAIEKVGFPSVLKPINGAASLGVKKVMSAQELREAYREVKLEMESTVVTSGALVKCKTVDSELDQAAEEAKKEKDDKEDMKPQVKCLFMLESYLDGPEVDVDVVMSGGEPQYVVVVDNGPTVEPYFNETWGLCPSQLNDEMQEELRTMAVESVKSCGFLAGVFHVELKYTSKGPRLIEINARMGGGQVRETHLRVFGVDLVDETLFTCVGIPCKPHKADPPKCCLAYNYVNAQKSGRVAHLKALEEVAKLPDVVYAKPLVQPGDEIVGPEEGMPTWVADIMVSKPTRAEALDFVLKLSQSLEIPIESKPNRKK
mmetsp:Transcript_18702/g.62718  ORF Transcript_18702/g.62718 Transcript_18702/m.62718 type:complete len:586 (+) Transcript_18702:40-1797(+)